MAACWSAPARAQLVDREARTTLGNAVAVARAARQLGADEVVVVTSRWHARRAAVLVRAALTGSGATTARRLGRRAAPARAQAARGRCLAGRSRPRGLRRPDPLGSRPCVAVSHSQEPCSPSWESRPAAAATTSPRRDSTAAWASDFCTAITGWTDELEGVTSQFTDTSNLSQDGIRSAADDVQTSTQDLVDEIRGLGAPPTESGDEVKTALDSLSTTLETESAEIQEAAEGVSGITDIPSALTAITTSLSAMATSFSETLTTVQDADVEGELQTALEDSPECADISS